MKEERSGVVGSDVIDVDLMEVGFFFGEVELGLYGLGGGEGCGIVYLVVIRV